MQVGRTGQEVAASYGRTPQHCLMVGSQQCLIPLACLQRRDCRPAHALPHWHRGQHLSLHIVSCEAMLTNPHPKAGYVHAHASIKTIWRAARALLPL